jgi:Kdo2-lipid A phosphotransferase
LRTRPAPAWRPLPLTLAHLAALALALSWVTEPSAALWQALDDAFFWLTNASLAGEGRAAWRILWAVANHRAMDAVAALAMAALVAHYAWRTPPSARPRILAWLILITLSCLVMLQVGKALPVDRPSPTRHHAGVVLLSAEVSSISTKDASSDSFPGDHGLVLMVFAGGVALSLPWAYGLAAGVMAVVFTLPRLMSGAHWLSDELVGALALALLALAWLYATPLQAWATARIEGLLPRRLVVWLTTPDGTPTPTT